MYLAEKHHIVMIKRAIQLEDITIINVYVTNSKSPKYMKQELIEMRNNNI